MSGAVAVATLASQLQIACWVERFACCVDMRTQWLIGPSTRCREQTSCSRQPIAAFGAGSGSHAAVRRFWAAYSADHGRKRHISGFVWL